MGDPGDFAFLTLELFLACFDTETKEARSDAAIFFCIRFEVETKKRGDDVLFWPNMAQKLIRQEKWHLSLRSN